MEWKLKKYSEIKLGTERMNINCLVFAGETALLAGSSKEAEQVMELEKNLIKLD